ncbi:MAG: helix-turn-helix domain-containing protein, partial [Verrucomicrobiota bacterium]
MPPTPPTTIKGLAEFLGVSPAAVSLCLNNRARDGRISPETERRVLEAAKRFDFRP